MHGQYVELTKQSRSTAYQLAAELRKPEHTERRNAVLLYTAHRKRIRPIPDNVIQAAIKAVVHVARHTPIGGFRGGVEQADKGFDLVCKILWDDLDEREHHDLLKTIP